MSTLAELIKTLCPSGVPYKKISEIGTLTRGKRFVHADAVDDGIPCIHYGEIYTYYGLWTDKTKSHVRSEIGNKLRYAKKNDVIIVGAGENDVDIGIAVAYLGDEDVAIHDACYVFRQNNDPKYISYCLRTAEYHNQIKKYVSTGKICSISAEGLGKARIPIPPIEIQKQIVEYLENYSLLTEKLIKRLLQELEVRRKQFEFYREKLLSFDKNDKQMKLEELCSVARGKVISKNDIQDNPGDYPVYSSQTENNGELGRINTYMYEGEYLTWTTDGANAGTVFYRNGKFNITNVCGILQSNEELVDIRYLYHFLTVAAPKYVSKGMGNPKLMSNVMKSIKVFVPPLSEQKRIADILERYNTACLGLISRISEEVSSRKSQYSFYRDKLLSFKEI